MGRLRVPDWAIQLDALISDARSRPFEWGEHDCGTFAAEVVRILTGTDLPLPRGYSTQRGAALAMRRKTGCSDMQGAAGFFLGEPLSCPEMAQRGDIVLHNTQALGVCTGLQAMCLSESGLIAVGIGECLTAWRV